MKGTDTFVNAARLLKCYHLADDIDDVTPAFYFINSIVVVGNSIICHMNPLLKNPYHYYVRQGFMISFIEL